MNAGFGNAGFGFDLSNRWRKRQKPARPSLCAEFFAPLCAPQGQDPAAALGRHASTEAVAALAHQFARLIRPFHASLQLQYWRGLYGTPSGPSNAV